MAKAKAVAKVDDGVKFGLQKMGPEFAKVLQNQIPEEKFVRIALNAIQTNPRLAECERMSLYGAFMKCAEDGLLPDGREAFINAYFDSKDKKTVASYQPMVLGFIKKVMQSGYATNVEPVVVYEKDLFEEWADIEGKKFKHEISREQDRGEITHAYVLITMPDGHNRYESMTRTEIEASRNKSKAPNSLMWKEFYSEGCKKTVIKRCLKRVPNLPEPVQKMIASDNEEYDLSEEKPITVVTQEEAEDKTPKILEKTLTNKEELL